MGPEAALAAERGLTGAEWYHSPVPRKRMKELMARRNGPAIRDTLLWFALLGVTGWTAHLTWGTWWCVAPFVAYGALYGGVSDSRWHECGHGTAFRSQWMNSVVYYLASFMVLREAVSWKWSHTRHHTDTLIVGNDPEIAVPRPTSIATLVTELFALRSGPGELRKIALNCLGRLTPAERSYIPASEHRRVFWTARADVTVWLGVIVWSVAIGSIEPLMFVGLPSFYGRWLVLLFGLTQHAGLAEDVLDHRLNSRTVYMNRVSRYLYWNMNYHIEHHMFPSVPFHSLPDLHNEIRHDLPEVYQGLGGAYREILPALVRQAKDPAYFIDRNKIGST